MDVVCKYSGAHKSIMLAIYQCFHILGYYPNHSQPAMESIRTSLRRIMAHMETQAVTPIDIQDPIMSRNAYDWSLTSTFEFRSWDMPDGIYAFNLLVKVERQDSGDYFRFLISSQVQTAIYHLYRLRQVQIDEDSGKYNYGLRDGVNSTRPWGRLVRQRQEYLKRLLGCLELEQERYERVGAWDVSHDIAGGVEEVENFLTESVNGSRL
jgi:hypothetical protein